MSRITFWALYARVYDTLGRLIPYVEMLTQAIDALDLQPGQRVLDLGCGTGNLEQQLAQTHPDCYVVATDASAAMLERARAKCPGGRFIAADLDAPLNQPQLTAAPFDAVVSTNVLYTLPEPARALRQFAAVARPGALMVQTTPRAGAQPLPILRQHLRLARQRRLPRRSPRLVGALILIAVFNAVILSRQRQGTYHFPSEDQLRSWYQDSGWRITNLTDTYAGQNWLITAERTH